MHDLRAADHARIGRFIASLNPVEAQGEEPFPRQFLKRLRGLVACERVQFCELDRVRQRALGSVIEPTYDTPWMDVTYWDIRQEHPLCRHQDETLDFTARRLSDFVSLRELRKQRVYVEWFRPLGQERLLTVGLDAPLRHTKLFLFSRAGGRDFARRDRAVLDVVRPWLAERYAAWVAHRRFVDLLHLVEAREGAVVVLDGPDRWAFATEAAQRLLERHFGCRGGTLPRPLSERLRGRTRGRLEIATDRGTLVVHALDGTLVLEEEAAAPGLTPREQEILVLVGEGKTNGEIAEQLWISAGTVRRHLENVYAKLGVHTRTGAVRSGLQQ